MKWPGKPSSFHLLTNPSMINRFIFGQWAVIYYVHHAHSNNSEKKKINNFIENKLTPLYVYNCVYYI